tara:strand:- start:2770 stop:3030 length:261 start_codon:yes stop_codon:yes gene_type:complete
MSYRFTLASGAGAGAIGGQAAIEKAALRAANAEPWKRNFADQNWHDWLEAIQTPEGLFFALGAVSVLYGFSPICVKLICILKGFRG